MAPLNAKHARFVAEYLIDLDATKAAIRSGYSRKTARQIGSHLLTKVDIAAAVAAGAAQHLERADLSADRTLEELRRLSFSSIKSLFDQDGNLRDIHTLTDAEAACIASVEVIIKNVAAGDGHVDTIHKIKMWDKVRALEMLAKYFKLLIEQVQVTGDTELVATLQRARARVLAFKQKGVKARAEKAS